MITTRRLPLEASTMRADGSGDAAVVMVVRRVRDVCTAASSAAAAQVTGRSA